MREGIHQTNPILRPGYDGILQLNLSGMPEYDPAFPKVMKWQDGESDAATGLFAGDVVTFIGVKWITGWSKENCSLSVGESDQFLGMQDAPRKFWSPSQTSAGAWTDTVLKLAKTLTTMSVTRGQWDKERRIVEELNWAIRESDDGRPKLNNKMLLEKETGFMNHLAMTFETISPFSKGFYLMLNSW